VSFQECLQFLAPTSNLAAHKLSPGTPQRMLITGTEATNPPPRGAQHHPANTPETAFFRKLPGPNPQGRWRPRDPGGENQAHGPKRGGPAGGGAHPPRPPPPGGHSPHGPAQHSHPAPGARTNRDPVEGGQRGRKTPHFKAPVGGPRGGPQPGRGTGARPAGAPPGGARGAGRNFGPNNKTQPTGAPNPGGRPLMAGLQPGPGPRLAGHPCYRGNFKIKPWGGRFGFFAADFFFF